MAKRAAGYPYQLADIEARQSWIESGPSSPIIKSTVKVLGVADGWVVYRHRGAAPHLMFWKDFVLRHSKKSA